MDQNQNPCDEGIWNQVSLSDEQIQKIENTQSSIMPNRDQLLKANRWLVFMEDYTNPIESRYKCKICSNYALVSKFRCLFQYNHS